MKDKRGILIQPGVNTQSGRQIRFTSFKDIVKLEPVLKSYVKEAIELEKAGFKLNFSK